MVNCAACSCARCHAIGCQLLPTKFHRFRYLPFILTLCCSKIDSVLQEEADGDDFNEGDVTNFCNQVCNPTASAHLRLLLLGQFEQLLLETDITVGVARRILEKRHDLKNRAFNDYKKLVEAKCVEAVGAVSA